MDNIIKRLLAVNPPDIKFVNVVTWLVHCVEVYSQSVNTGKGSSKFAIFRDAVPEFLHQATMLGLCTPDHAAAVQAQFDADWQVVSDIVSALVSVAHNPEFVQIEAELKGCFARCGK